METVPVRLNITQSVQFVEKLSQSHHPVDLLFSKSSGTLSVFIDGTETVHKIQLYDDGTWCVETDVEI